MDEMDSQDHIATIPRHSYPPPRPHLPHHIPTPDILFHHMPQILIQVEEGIGILLYLFMGSVQIIHSRESINCPKTHGLHYREEYAPYSHCLHYRKDYATYSHWILWFDSSPYYHCLPHVVWLVASSCYHCLSHWYWVANWHCVEALFIFKHSHFGAFYYIKIINIRNLFDAHDYNYYLSRNRRYSLNTLERVMAEFGTKTGASYVVHRRMVFHGLEPVRIIRKCDPHLELCSLCTKTIVFITGDSEMHLQYRFVG
eukprot:936775_1